MPAGPAWDDLDDFLDTDDFAVSAVITYQAGGTLSLRGIFDGPYRQAELADSERDATLPVLTVPEALVAGVRRGDRVAITFPAPFGVQTFDILAGAKPDGTGLAVLELAEP